MGIQLKVITVLLSISSVTLAEFNRKVFIENIIDCMKDHHLTPQEIQSLGKPDFDEEKNKCYITCIGEKFGIIKNGELSEEGAVSAADNFFSKDDVEKKEKFQAIAKECSANLKTLSTKGCDIGPATKACLIKGAEDRELLPK
uniref:Odorant-binding protein 5 n=1 Tax=Matsumurasca onukii TaxID=2912585 RepID=A0A343WGW9_MATON|nr:odorant-binding protein 5 [Matsumurasca onukii]